MNIKNSLILAVAASSVLAAGAPPRRVFKPAPPHPASKAAITGHTKRHFAPSTTAVLPPVQITIDAQNVTHRIDPNIYGVAFADTARFLIPAEDLGATINRWGGNAVSTHNWFINTTNRAKDYYFENIPDDVQAGQENTPGEAADEFIQPTIAAGRDALMTVPLLDRLPKSPRPTFSPDTIPCSYDTAAHPSYVGQGCCADFDFAYRARCGNGRDAVTGDRLLNVNNPDDNYDTFTSAHQANWITHLIATHGTAASGNGVRFYALDNEPSLWSFDHWDIHPNGATTDEVWGDMAEYGAMIKATDPTSLTTGVEEWGWDGYFYSGADQENYPNGYPDQAAHDNIPYTRYLLRQARKYEEANGTRILDYFTLHFYPQGGEFSNDDSGDTQLLRNRSTRGLWDPNYVNESYIASTGIDGGIVRLIPRMREWVNNEYPGTKIGLTEYNWGDEGTGDPGDNGYINGATAQADVLGILGREGADMAVRWTSPPSANGRTLVYKAFQMYRNYDGLRSTFGDLSLSVAANDPNNLVTPNDIADDISVFGALRSSDGALTVMIISKTPGGVTRTINLGLSNFTPSGATAQRWQLDSTNNITQLASVTLGSPTSFTVAPQTITLLVVPGSFLQAPTELQATANALFTALTWVSKPGASTHHVYRKTDGGAFVEITCTNLTLSGCTDNDGIAPNHAYLYRVQAEGAGPTFSGFSNIDQANTFAFTNEDLCQPAPPPDIPIRAVDFAELRTAIDAVRTNAGIATATYTHPSPVAGNSVVTIEDIRELRLAVNQTRAWLNRPNVVYVADPVITQASTPVKKSHVCELREALR